MLKHLVLRSGVSAAGVLPAAAALERCGQSHVCAGLLAAPAMSRRLLHDNARQLQPSIGGTLITANIDEEKEALLSIFPDCVKDLTHENDFQDIPEFPDILSKVLQYTMPGLCLTQSLTTVLSYKLLAHPKDLTDENIRLARILGWCCEILEASAMVADDLMDQSELRRGRQCWYKVDGRGLAAINDAFVLEHSAFQLLKIHFRDKPFYEDLVELLQEGFRKVAIGQAMDLNSSKNGRPNFDFFTMDRLRAINSYKSAYAFYVMPADVGMCMSKNGDSESIRIVKEVIHELGLYMQARDDSLDHTEKDATDIQNGKCSWAAVAALQRASPEQRKIMEACYGSYIPQQVAKVKKIYEDLKLSEEFSAYEAETYNLLRMRAAQLPSNFSELLQKLGKIFPVMFDGFTY